MHTTAHTTLPAQRSEAPRADAVTTTALSKRFGARQVVDEVTLRVPRGSVTGLVGPNGAGKTTLMAMLMGLVAPTSGTATILGHDVRQPEAYLPRVGALIESPAFHPGLTGTENPALLCRLGGHDRGRLPATLELVGLAERAGDRYGTYSLGMKQRLGIAGALLGDPQLVVLDEPTNGVDPQGMRDIRAMIRRIAAEDRTVLVSSHLLTELEHVCDHLVVMERGTCRYDGPLADLSSGPDVLHVRAARGQQDALEQLLRGRGLPPRSGPSGSLTVPVDADADDLAASIHRSAAATGIDLVEIVHPQQSLEERVLALVGHPNGNES